MIASRRRAHRVLVLVLAPISLVLLVASVMGRRPEPVVGALPGLLSPESQETGEPLWSRDDVFPSWPARVLGYRTGAIELKPLRPLDRPDVLLYWTPGSSSEGRLPEDAHLIGRIGSTRRQRFQLPNHDTAAGAPPGGGTLIVYSLGHQEVVAEGRLPRLDGATAE